jgi:cbb3-type cytochrome oxidase subunit 1
MRFARWVFAISGVLGIIIMVPMYFLENRMAVDNPPAITHPEIYYGFVGVTLAWQLMFLFIAADPARYRLSMLPAVVEKASFVIAIAVLLASGRVGGSTIGFAALDGMWMILFSVAYRITPKT